MRIEGTIIVRWLHVAVTAPFTFTLSIPPPPPPPGGLAAGIWWVHELSDGWRWGGIPEDIKSEEDRFVCLCVLFVCLFACVCVVCLLVCVFVCLFACVFCLFVCLPLFTMWLLGRILLRGDNVTLIMQANRDRMWQQPPAQLTHSP